MMTPEQMNDQEIVTHWERVCAAQEESGISDDEWKRRGLAVYEFSVTTPRHLRVIMDTYAREFPNGPPPGTPGLTEHQRLAIVDFAARWRG